MNVARFSEPNALGTTAFGSESRATILTPPLIVPTVLTGLLTLYVISFLLPVLDIGELNRKDPRPQELVRGGLAFLRSGALLLDFITGSPVTAGLDQPQLPFRWLVIDDPDADVQAIACMSLASKYPSLDVPLPSAMPVLRRHLSDDNAQVRTSAAMVIFDLSSADDRCRDEQHAALEAMTDILKNGDRNERGDIK